MPTIKDVAKCAGVSHGTVSNVINGAKTVNIEIVNKVNAAIHELGYTIDLKARNLRSNKSDMVGVILPNISDNIYSSIHKGIEHITIKNGCNICLFTTDDFIKQEENALNQVLQQKMLGVCIVSCNPQNYTLLKQLVESSTSIVFLRRKPSELMGQAFAEINEYEAIYKLTTKLLSEGKKVICLITANPTFSNESDCIRGFKKAYFDKNIKMSENYVQNTVSGLVGAFQKTAWLMNSSEIIDAIITTCDEFSKGVLAATNIFNNIKTPEIYCLTNESWIQPILPSSIFVLPQKYNLLGQKAAQSIFEKSNQNILLEGICPENFNSQKNNTDIKCTKKILKMLLLECSASYATRLLSRRFTEETGIELIIDIESYDKIYEQIFVESNSDNYDIFQVNQPWLETLTKNDLLLDLTNYLDFDSLDYSKDILNIFSISDNKFMAVPYILDTQLLFYRKDLFEDLQNQRLFYNRNKKPLEIPKTWQEFDLISKFFTKKYNSDSLIEFGCALGGFPFNAVYSFMLRYWELGGSLLDDKGKLSINNEAFYMALKDYINATQYSDEKALYLSWNDQAQAFSDGKVAMIAMYQSHITDYISQFNSKVNGEVAICSVPGNYNVRGGWCLGISKRTSAKNQSSEFLKWASSKDITQYYNILGGSIPSKSSLLSTEMSFSKPWFYQAYKDLSKSRKMIENNNLFVQWDFEKVFGSWLLDCVLNKNNFDMKNSISRITFELNLLIHKK